VTSISLTAPYTTNWAKHADNANASVVQGTDAVDLVGGAFGSVQHDNGVAIWSRLANSGDCTLSFRATPVSATTPAGVQLDTDLIVYLNTRGDGTTGHPADMSAWDAATRADPVLYRQSCAGGIRIRLYYQTATSQLGSYQIIVGYISGGTVVAVSGSVPTFSGALGTASDWRITLSGPSLTVSQTPVGGSTVTATYSNSLLASSGSVGNVGFLASPGRRFTIANPVLTGGSLPPPPPPPPAPPPPAPPPPPPPPPPNADIDLTYAYVLLNRRGNLALPFASNGGGSVYMARVPVRSPVGQPGNIANRNLYEFFAGTDSAGRPTWTGTSPGVAVRNDPNGIGRHLSIDYAPALRKYVAAATNRHNIISIEESPRPWGGWGTLAYGRGSDPQWTEVYSARVPGGWATTSALTLAVSGSPPAGLDVQTIPLFPVTGAFATSTLPMGPPGGDWTDWWYLHKDAASSGSATAATNGVVLAGGAVGTPTANNVAIWSRPQATGDFSISFTTRRTAVTTPIGTQTEGGLYLLVGAEAADAVHPNNIAAWVSATQPSLAGYRAIVRAAVLPLYQRTQADASDQLAALLTLWNGDGTTTSVAPSTATTWPALSANDYLWTVRKTGNALTVSQRDPGGVTRTATFTSSSIGAIAADGNFGFVCTAGHSVQITGPNYSGSLRSFGPCIIAGTKWPTTTIRYGFPQIGFNSWPDTTWNGITPAATLASQWSPCPANVQAAVRRVVGNIASATGLTFLETTDMTQAQVRLAMSAVLNPLTDDADGVSFFPTNGSVFFAENLGGQDWSQNSSYAHLAAHEFCHAIGLRHPPAASGFNNTNTLMPHSWTDITFPFPETPFPIDIEALREFYLINLDPNAPPPGPPPPPPPPQAGVAPHKVLVASLPTDPNSATMASRFWALSHSRPGGIDCTFSVATYPLYDARDADGLYPVVLAAGATGNLNGATMPFRPGSWQPATGTFGRMIVADPLTGREWDLFQASFVNGAVTCADGWLVPGDYRTRTDPYPTRPSGFIYQVGLVTAAELATGRINHALSCAFSGVDFTSFVAPAIGTDGGTYGTANGVPEGTRFALTTTDAEITAWIATLPADMPAGMLAAARVIVTALRDYGWFVTEAGGTTFFHFEDRLSGASIWNSIGLAQYQSTDGKVYPRDILDGILTQDRIRTIVPSDQYPGLPPPSPPPPAPPPPPPPTPPPPPLPPPTPLSQFVRVFRGRLKSYSYRGGDLVWSVEPASGKLDSPIQTLTYDGSGGLGGPPDMKGRSKPRALGRCLGVEPLQIDPFRNIYQAHGYGGIHSFNGVQDKGVDLEHVRDYGTYAELQDAVADPGDPELAEEGVDIPAGTYATCNAVGCFRLGIPAAGRVTCQLNGEATFVDVTGTWAGGVTWGGGALWGSHVLAEYFSGARHLINKVLTEEGVLPPDDVDSLNIDHLGGLDPDGSLDPSTGIYLGPGETTTRREVVTRLAASGGVVLFPNRAAVWQVAPTVVPTTPPAGAIVLDDDMLIGDFRRVDLPWGQPWSKLRIAHSRNWTLFTDTDIAGAATADARAFSTREAAYIELTDPAVPLLYPDAPPATFELLLSDAQVAAPIARQLLDWYDHRRGVFTGTFTGVFGRTEMLQPVVVRMPRLGLSAGRVFVVVGLRELTAPRRTELTLYG
jgi:hypothetical protein